MEKIKIFGLGIDFPEIEGYTNRQIWYAERLREEYVRRNEDSFREIDEMVSLENDSRIVEDGGNYINDYKNLTFSMTLNAAEKMCLFCKDAGGLIGFFKANMDR